MSIKIAKSGKERVSEAVQDLKEQLAGIEPALVIYFASAVYPPEALSAAMQESFSPAVVAGCSSAGEIASGELLKNSAVAMAFDRQTVADAKVEVLQRLGEGMEVTAAFAGFENHFGVAMEQMDPSAYVGLVLVDGLSGAEENLMDRVGDLTHVTFIGGSAGDDLKFQATHVFASGKSYRDAALLVLLKPGVPFTFVKTQSFSDLGKKLAVTRANEASREVVEFDGKPAAQAYADALGVSLEKAGERFMHNPVGLVIEGEPYVRSPQQVVGGGMRFYCGVVEGMELSLLESTDIIKDTRDSLARAHQELGGISGILNFNCILRTLELESKGLTGEYGRLFAEFPTVGFSTYGEQYIGHINQTATMLVFR